MIATIRRSNPVGPHTDLPNPALDAVAAEAGCYAPHRNNHPYPTCFGCGPRRSAGDGMHRWAALDCGRAGTRPRGYPRGHGVVTGEPVVDIRDRVPCDTTAVIVSRTTPRGGRKEHVAAALIDRETGRHYAAGTSVWFTVATEPAA